MAANVPGGKGIELGHVLSISGLIRKEPPAAAADFRLERVLTPGDVFENLNDKTARENTFRQLTGRLFRPVIMGRKPIGQERTADPPYKTNRPPENTCLPLMLLGRPIPRKTLTSDDIDLVAIGLIRVLGHMPARVPNSWTLYRRGIGPSRCEKCGADDHDGDWKDAFFSEQQVEVFFFVWDEIANEIQRTGRGVEIVVFFLDAFGRAQSRRKKE